MVGATIPVNTDAGSTTNPTSSRFAPVSGNATSPNSQVMLQSFGTWQQAQQGSTRQRLNYLAYLREQQAVVRQAAASQAMPQPSAQSGFYPGLVGIGAGIVAMPSMGLDNAVDFARNVTAFFGGGPQQVSPEEMVQYRSAPPAIAPYATAGSRADMAGNLTGQIPFEARIKALEQSIGYRKAAVASELYDYDEKTGQFSYKPGSELLGIMPGYVPAPGLNRPAPGASMDEMRAYEQQLRSQVRKPLYTAAVFQNEFNNLGIEGIKRFQKRMIQAGLYDEKESVLLGLPGSTEQEAMQMLMARANMNGVTYDQVLDLLIEGKKQQDAAGGGGGGGGGKGGRFTNVTYSLTSISQARQILAQVLKSSIGRDPTDDEVNQFLRQLNTAEQASPVVTTTTTTGRQSVSRTTPSGVDPQEMALQFAQEIGGGDEYRENRALYYFNLIAQKYGYGFGQG